MPRPKNPDLHHERQHQILEAARVIFAEQGLADARMDDIALKSGLSKGSLYLYYKNKDALIEGLLEGLFDGLLNQIQVLVETDNRPVDVRLTEYGDNIAASMDVSMLNIAYEFYAVGARRPAVRQFLQRYFAAYRQMLATLFSQGISRGEYPPFDVDQAALTLIALLEGLTLLWFTDSAVPLDEMLPPIMQQFLNNLKNK